MKFFFLFVGSLFYNNWVDAQRVESKNLLDHIGDTVTISGKIYSGAFLVNVKTKPTFLNLGDTNPSHRLMIRIEPEDRDKFPFPPEIYFLNKQVSVTGVVNNYKGTALIKVAQPGMITTERSITADNPPVLAAIIKGTVFPVSSSVEIKKVNENKPVEKKIVEKKLPDTLLQAAWMNKFANKNVEQITKNLRVVEKEISLRISPNDKAPVIAVLNPGIVISVLDKSRKWSHIIVRTVDGSNSVFGFVKNKSLRHLKRLQ